MISEATRLLKSTNAGQSHAKDALFAMIYDELVAIAERYLRRERPNHTLQPSALVHEAYAKLIDDSMVDDLDRTTFKAYAARSMERILVDYARQRNAQKRGADWRRTTLSGIAELSNHGEVDFEALRSALDRLRNLDSRHADVVNLKFFGGLTIPEIARVLDVSEPTVQRDWRLAQAWLRARLSEATT